MKKILVIRTDRIGDVLLSTPVIKALRDAYPKSYIAMMVRPYARDVVVGNPYLDEVIFYDKYGRHKRIRGTIGFIRELRKRRFDLAVVLHPTNRANIISFLTGIKERVGYNSKCGFLLTKRIEDKKYLGEKHEIEYSLDVVRSIGVEVKDFDLFMPIKDEDERYINKFLEANGVSKSDRLIAIHPGASCLSKLWPPERFAEVADRLIKKYGAKVIIVSGVEDVGVGKEVGDSMDREPIVASGKTTIGQLSSLLKRCSLFISNDSGPVHIAVAVGTSVIAIFGRNQPGLSPLRWRPTGGADIILHKDVGCRECLAHRCQVGFKCLKAITVEEVLGAADHIFSLC